MLTVDLRSTAQAEARRLEQECASLAGAHELAASRWSRVHFAFGIPSTLLAGATSVAAFAEAHIEFLGISSDQLAGVTALLVGIFTALATFLDSNQKAGAHRAAWARYEAIRHKVRLVGEFELTDRPLDPVLREATGWLEQISAAVDEANATTPHVRR